MTDKQMLNFRCSVELLEAIDQVGRDRYPAQTKSGCDRSKTLVDILSAGIQALTDGSVTVPIRYEVRQHTEVRQSDNNIETLKAELQIFVTQMIEDKMGELQA